MNRSFAPTITVVAYKDATTFIVGALIYSSAVDKIPMAFE